jgi:ketosteroid isomerase-like protein
LLCVPLLASPATADPQKIDKDSHEALLGKAKETAHPMVSAERAFARTSVQEGMRRAFLAYLSEDAVIFRPKPVEGRQWFTEQKNITGQLSWEPTYAEVSSSGDLGFSTGPFQYQEQATEKNKTSAVQHGHFVSVWEKQSPGWRVVLDHGIPHPKPRDKAKPEFKVREGGKMGTIEETIPALSRIDKKFANVTSAELLQELYNKHAADDLRIYRRNLYPITGKDRVLEVLPKVSVLVKGALEGAGLSKDGDLAYSYGMGTMGKLDRDQRSQATYLRLWRNDGKQNFKLMLDLVMPLPQEGVGAPTQ